MVAAVMTPSDQKRRRRRARINLSEVARRLDISIGALSQYENEKTPLPFALTPEDYERELQNAIRDKERGL